MCCYCALLCIPLLALHAATLQAVLSLTCKLRICTRRVVMSTAAVFHTPRRLYNICTDFGTSLKDIEIPCNAQLDVDRCAAISKGLPKINACLVHAVML